MISARRLRPPALLIGAGASLAAFAVLAVLVWLAHGPIGPDARIHSLLIDSRSPSRDSMARLLTFTGSGPFVYPMACGVAAALFALRRRGAALWFLVAFFGGALACGATKVLIDRLRPDPTAMLGAAETGMSFPSGHTCMGTLLFVGAAIAFTAPHGRSSHEAGTASAGARAPAVAAAAAWAALIAWSRLVLGFHWLTDTIGSALLATSLLLALAWFADAPRLRIRHRAAQDTSPAPSLPSVF